MSRLLFDFSNVLKGGDFTQEDLGCLRYCLTVISSKFLRRQEKFEIGKLVYYGRNEILGEGVEIESMLGTSWSDLIV